MSNISLQDAVLVVSVERKKAYVVRKGDVQYPSKDYRFVGGGRSSVFKMNDTAKMLSLFIDAWHAVLVHGIPPEEVHAALGVIAEYKETLGNDLLPKYVPIIQTPCGHPDTPPT